MRMTTSSFRLLSYTSTQKKDAEWNARKNINAFKEIFKDQVLGYYVGSTAENDNSAMTETRVLFDEIIHYLKNIDYPYLQELNCMNGVERRPIIFGDLFHMNNCIVTTFSVEAFWDITLEAHS